MNPITLLRRAFASPAATTLSEAERARHEAAGISEPAVQRYLAWRRALIFMVVIATVLSAGLTTYRSLTENDDDEPALLESIMEPLMAKFSPMLPADAGGTVDKVKEQLSALPLPKKAEVAAEGDTVVKTKAESEEDEEEEVQEHKNAFEKFTDIMESVSLYVLAVMALVALVLGNNLRLSFRVLTAGFLFGFLVPMLVAMCPWSWFGHAEAHFSLAKEPMKYLKDMAEGLMEGASYLLLLLPTVLSLVPGVLKGCLKVKSLLPQSLLPGWFIVLAAPLYGLFLLVIFIAVDQVTAEPLLLAGMALLVLAHFLYAFRASAFTSPLLEEADHRRLKGALLSVLLVTAAAGVLLLVFLLTREVLGVHIFGTDPKKSLMQPLDLVEFALEFVARSMFITALSVDLFMRLNLMAWRHIRALAMSEKAAADYQRAMGALEGMVG